MPFKLPKLIKIILTKIFKRTTVRLSKGEQAGFSRGIKMILKHRMLVSAFIISGTAAAVFEGGTLGLLGLSVSVLIGDQDLSFGQLSGPIGDQINSVLETISRGGLFLLLVGFAVTAQIFKSLLVYLCLVVQIYLTTILRREIQREGTAHVMAMSYSEVSDYPPGTIATLIDQSDVLEHLVTQVGNSTRAILMLFSYMTILLWMSVTTTLSVSLLIVIFWFSMNSIVRKLRKLSSEATQGQIDLWRSSVEYLNAPKLLRTFNCTDHAAAEINRARDTQIFAARRADVIETAIPPAIEVLTIFACGLFLIFGYLLEGDGANAAVPRLFVYVLVFYRLKPIIKALSDFRTKMARILPPLERVANFLNVNDKEFTRAGGLAFSGLQRGISINNLSFSYKNSDAVVLSDININIGVGETVALVGESGVGKSTLVDLILGLYEPTQGSISVDSMSLNELDLVDWRGNIGVVDQEAFLLNASVIDNIRFSRFDATDDEIVFAARSAHAHDFIVRLENGYNTVIGNRGFKLSGGQRQRIALARALVRDPQILVLDEATSALDTDSERAIQQALEEMRSARTIIVVAHRLSTIAGADKIVVLKNGSVLEKGTLKELLAKSSYFARLWELQTGIS